MEQHPVPQHITSYEFRLVGDMTLRQFGYLAGGIITGLIFYGSPIPAYFKWPLILVSGFTGFALAFLPIEERPLSTWIIAFSRAVISPTLFIWKKKPETPAIFVSSAYIPVAAKLPAGPTDKTQLNEYLRSLSLGKSLTALDQQEANSLSQINNLFQVAKISFPTTQIQPLPQITIPPVTPISPPLRDLKVPVEPVSRQPVSRQPPLPEGPAPVLPPRPKKTAKSTVQAKLSSQLPIPSPPTRPNILVGMVLDNQGEIIEGAIIEIRDTQGLPARALKTNRLGQFAIATPLADGLFEIETEKEGYQFDIIKIELNGKIIQPMEIRAKLKN